LLQLIKHSYCRSKALESSTVRILEKQQQKTCPNKHV
jgi:hypothetical protein